MCLKIQILLLLSFSICFGLDIENIKEHLKTNKISGDFIQKKEVSGFSTPLISSGNFSLNDGIFIQNTLKPILLSIQVTQKGVYELRNNQLHKISSVFDENLFLNILNLNIDNLKNDFDIKLSGSMEDWNLILIPKGFLAKIFIEISIYGDEFVRRLTLKEVSGDLTNYEFLNIK